MILSLLCSCETPLGALHPDLEHPAQEEPTQVHPEEDCEDGQRAGTPLLGRQAERLERRLQRTSNSIPVSKGDLKESQRGTMYQSNGYKLENLNLCLVRLGFLGWFFWGGFLGYFLLLLLFLF